MTWEAVVHTFFKIRVLKSFAIYCKQVFFCEYCKIFKNTVFFCLGFLSRPFTNYRTTGEGGGHFINSSLPLPPASQVLHISRAITAESSPLHIGSSQTQTGNLWFPSASRSPLNYSPFFYKHLLWLRLTFHTYQVQVELLFFHYLPRATSWRATRMTIILFQKSLILFKFWV